MCLRQWLSFLTNFSLLRPAGDFQQVVAELSLNRTVNDVHFVVENDFVEFRNHLPLSEFSEIAAALTGRALRVFFGDVRKVSTGFDVGFEFQAGCFVRDENVSSGCSGHNKNLSVVSAAGSECVEAKEKSCPKL